MRSNLRLFTLFALAIALGSCGGGDPVGPKNVAPATGAIALTISGLPANTTALVTVTGPGGSTQANGSQTLSGLTPGEYTISALPVTGAGDRYDPTPATQTVTVAAGFQPSATVTYSLTPPVTLNFSIPTLYLVQSVQRPNGSIPLVAGRDAYLRVFATANQSNSSAPDVRIRLYQGGTVVLDTTVDEGQSGVPTSVQEGSLAASWDLLVPGALIQSGLEVLAEVNPGAQVTESDPNDNTWPANGQPGALDVRVLPDLKVTFIPIHQTDGSTGNITSGNSGQYTVDIRRMWPVGTMSTSIGATYNFTGPVLQSDDANGSWGTLLNEIQMLRASMPGTAYLYGVVHANYGSGLAGLGYVPSSPSSTSKTAIGWDHLPSGGDVFAHEIGHNFGRQHAPCGGVTGSDPDFPHAGGGIGYYGMDVAALSLKAPSNYKDLMGYCDPTWVSDYNYMAVMNYRLASPLGAPPAATDMVDGLLVWGRITDDSVILEPAFRVRAPARIPEGNGPYRIEGFANDGSLSFSYAFQGAEVADLPGGPQRHFAFVIPAGREVSSIKLVTLRLSRTRQSRTAMGIAGAARTPSRPASASRIGGGRVRLDWDAGFEPMVMVRDASGQIISFARGGSATLLQPAGGKLDLQFSDGVRTREIEMVIR